MQPQVRAHNMVPEYQLRENGTRLRSKGCVLHLNTHHIVHSALRLWLYESTGVSIDNKLDGRTQTEAPLVFICLSLVVEILFLIINSTRSLTNCT